MVGQDWIARVCVKLNVQMVATIESKRVLDQHGLLGTSHSCPNPFP